MIIQSTARNCHVFQVVRSLESVTQCYRKLVLSSEDEMGRMRLAMRGFSIVDEDHLSKFVSD